MSAPLRILLIDDDQDDFVLTRDVLAQTMRVDHHLDWARSYESGLDAMANCDHDVYLLDYNLGARSGIDLLHESTAINCDSPIILLTGQGQHEIDIEALRAGAADYLSKDNLDATLERAIRYAIERHTNRRALHQLNEALERRVEQRTAELERANAALKDADRRKDEFIAILAHELRNPLAPISNSLALLGIAADDAELCREACQTMERQLRHIVRLIDDLLEVSRISRGKIELRKSKISLQSAINDAVETAMPLADQKGHRLDVQVPADVITLDADPTRISQIVGNLLNNACKFTPRGGEIRLAVEERPKEVRITVRDNGIGIAADHLPRIFEMFGQVDSSLERSEGGLGIGLTLVRSLVEMHGGSVEVKSAGPGRGTEFVVRLPTVSRDHSASTPATASTAPPGAVASRRVLVVDDNRDSANSLVKLLRLEKHDARCVFDGLHAVEEARGFQPDVVLLDIGLPRLNGHEAARQIRAECDGRPIILVALTGWGQDEDRQRSRAAGFDYHLVKPIDRATLTKILNHTPPIAGRES
jgi:signal transduction histidine kinase